MTNIYFHYCGYGTVSGDQPGCAGWWKIGKNEFVKIEDLIKMFSLHSARSHRQVKLSVYADTPGAGGLFYRLI